MQKAGKPSAESRQTGYERDEDQAWSDANILRMEPLIAESHTAAKSTVLYFRLAYSKASWS